MKKKAVFILLSALLLMGGASSQKPNITGRWENSERLIDAKPGDIQINLNKDGTGDLILDKDQYFWVAEKFLYQVLQNQIEVTLVYEDGRRLGPGRLDIIRMNAQELVLFLKESKIKLSFRKIK